GLGLPRGLKTVQNLTVRRFAYAILSLVAKGDLPTMRITKFGHSCLLVEMPGPDGRSALFDPGVFSTVDVASLQRLDEIFITHNHSDHMDIELIKKLVAKFPDVRILATTEAVEELAGVGIKATNEAWDGVRLFDSPHESVEPLFVTPQEHGIHYLDTLT